MEALLIGGPADGEIKPITHQSGVLRVSSIVPIEGASPADPARSVLDIYWIHKLTPHGSTHAAFIAYYHGLRLPEALDLLFKTYQQGVRHGR